MASKRRLRRKSCAGKLVHNRQDALYHAHLLRRKTGEHVVAYKCKFGQHWHVGHQSSRVRVKVSAPAASPSRRATPSE